VDRESAARGISSFWQVGDASLGGNFVIVFSGGNRGCRGGGKSVEALAFAPPHGKSPAL
jgi:hypothetical protein